VNFFSGVVALKYFVPLLGATGEHSAKGVIWVTSSTIYRYDPKSLAMGYALSKFTAAPFVEYVHEAHSENGVTAFGIQPGSVMTDMGKYELPEGKEWDKSTPLFHSSKRLANDDLVLIDDVNLGGGLCVWLTKERREWLSERRWVDARWDTDELEKRKGDIVEKDLLKFRMTI
jgi:NAD(P)-dependent dehydrogenase (short-subunit alcohol dehydrogenase family)